MVVKVIYSAVWWKKQTSSTKVRLVSTTTMTIILFMDDIKLFTKS